MGSRDGSGLMGVLGMLGAMGQGGGLGPSSQSLMDIINDAGKLAKAHDISTEVAETVMEEALAHVSEPTRRLIGAELKDANTDLILWSVLAKIGKLLSRANRYAIQAAIVDGLKLDLKVAVLESVDYTTEAEGKVVSIAGEHVKPGVFVLVDVSRPSTRPVCGNPICTDHVAPVIGTYGMREEAEGSEWHHRLLPEHIPLSMLSAPETWTLPGDGVLESRRRQFSIPGDAGTSQES
jgi:hypothetical protein